MTNDTRFQQPIFWHTQFCPTCGYTSGVAYTPDLINENLEFRCFKPCGTTWGYAADEEAIKKIIKQVKLATERVSHLKRIFEIDDLLTPKEQSHE